MRNLNSALKNARKICKFIFNRKFAKLNAAMIEGDL